MTYKRPQIDASPESIQAMIDNYHFPLTVNTTHEEEALSVFKMYLGKFRLDLITADHKYQKYKQELDFISNAQPSQEVIKALVDAIKLYDLDRIL